MTAVAEAIARIAETKRVGWEVEFGVVTRGLGDVDSHCTGRRIRFQC